MTDIATKPDIIKLLDELTTFTQSGAEFTVTVVDLVVNSCNYALQKWAELKPTNSAVGVLLLSIELQCIKMLEDEKISNTHYFTRKDGTP